MLFRIRRLFGFEAVVLGDVQKGWWLSLVTNLGSTQPQGVRFLLARFLTGIESRQQIEYGYMVLV